ncbi:protein ATP6V1FNB [Colossoma macropomum]|uniref:protein ATP6V1FNB n=1 Tax=Colossoma macropomum TaxID=42526 RepID=UPI001863E03A|nr:protein ATP6V1FNB [Colossoma macropomum]
MRNLLTTQNQNCYRELIMKEAYTRLTWKMKYSKDCPTSFTTRRAKTIGLFNPPKPSTEISLPPVVQPQGKKKEAPVLVGRSLSEAPLMRPVSPKTKETLYHGFSKEGKGRSVYLKRRAQKMPEDKFDYPILSSWEYGWRLGDYEHNYRSPANGRSGVVRSTFYARNGIFNIPSATDKLG